MDMENTDIKPALHDNDPALMETPEEQDTFLALLPLKNVVILPKSIIPIIVGRASSIHAVEHALKGDKTIFITAQKDSTIEIPSEHDVFAYGTRSIILQVMRMPNGALRSLPKASAELVL